MAPLDGAFLVSALLLFKPRLAQPEVSCRLSYRLERMRRLLCRSQNVQRARNISIYALCQGNDEANDNFQLNIFLSCLLEGFIGHFTAFFFAAPR